jgi:uncharacterized membrane protein
MSKKIIFIFLIAFLIRLIALNQSLWLDEGTTARVVSQYNYSEILTKFSPHDFHPPLYYLFLKGWTGIFGYSEITLRMPSVLFSLLTGYLVYLLGGVWAAIFFLFNPLIIYYSQEARMYMMMTLFTTAGIYYMLKSLSVNELTSYGLKNQKLKIKDQNDNSKFKYILFMNLFFILSFYTFYGSIFLIMAMFIYFLYKKQCKFFLFSLFIFLFSFILISPLLYQQLVNAKVSLTAVTNWSLVLGKANLKNLLLIPIKFSIGRISFYPKWLYWGIAGIWTTFIWLFVLIQKLKVKSLLFLLLFPLILGFIVSFFVPMLQYFRFLFLIPIMAIILASANVSTCLSAGRYIAIIGFVVFSSAYLLLPQFHREDWKSLVRSLPKDKPVYMILASSDPVKYYNRSLKVLRLESLKESKENNIIVVPYTAEIYGFDYQKILKEKNYRLTDKKTFRGLVLEQYSKQ